MMKITGAHFSPSASLTSGSAITATPMPAGSATAATSAWAR